MSHGVLRGRPGLRRHRSLRCAPARRRNGAVLCKRGRDLRVVESEPAALIRIQRLDNPTELQRCNPFARVAPALRLRTADGCVRDTHPDAPFGPDVIACQTRPTAPPSAISLHRSQRQVIDIDHPGPCQGASSSESGTVFGTVLLLLHRQLSSAKGHSHRHHDSATHDRTIFTALSGFAVRRA